MIAMQYSFTLPADYDMGIIEKRIADNGYRTDGFAGLIFKTYLYARRNCLQTGSAENIYAPFYLWQDVSDMNRFISGAGFQGVAGAFGWPQIRVYPVLAAKMSNDVAQAVYAKREITDIAPFSDLAPLAEENINDRLIDVTAWDTTNWKKIHFTAGRNPLAGGGQNYRIGHISLSGAVKAV